MSMQSNILNAQPIKVENKQNNGINLFKFLCAILVVGIHTEPFGNLGILDSLFGIITRIAVPYFFVCSSYFYFLKGDTIQKLKHYIKRIFTLYLLWSIVYLAYDIYIYIYIRHIHIPHYLQLYTRFLFTRIQALLVSSGKCRSDYNSCIA